MVLLGVGKEKVSLMCSFWDAVWRVLYVSVEDEAALAGRLHRLEWERRTAQSDYTQKNHYDNLANKGEAR